MGLGTWELEACSLTHGRRRSVLNPDPSLSPEGSSNTSEIRPISHLNNGANTSERTLGNSGPQRSRAQSRTQRPASVSTCRKASENTAPEALPRAAGVPLTQEGPLLIWTTGLPLGWSLVSLTRQSSHSPQGRAVPQRAVPPVCPHQPHTQEQRRQ